MTMAYLDWKVGDKVVCVAAGMPTYKTSRWGQFNRPEVGTIYTLREIFVETRFTGISTKASPVFIRLMEVTNPEVDTYVGPYEPAFSARCFRKVQPHKTDITIFTAMLDPSRQQVDA